MPPSSPLPAITIVVLEPSEQTIGQAQAGACRQLHEAGVDFARLDAELLLGHVTGKSRTRLAIDADHDLSADQRITFQQLIERRAGGEPLAYLIGKRDFLGHDFVVGPGVLIPRPETELMVELAIACIDRLWPRRPVRVLDLCTGSGAIALALAQQTNPSFVSVVGSDISGDALAYAARNREAFGFADRVALVQGDVLEWTPGPWDMILTNPPYLTPQQVDANPDLAAEPRIALDGGHAGRALIERILEQAGSRVAPRFAMTIELDPAQADAVAALVSARFPTADVIIVPDLTGRARFVSIERQESRR